MYKFSSKFLCAYVVCTSVLNILVQSGCMFFYKTMLQLHKHPKHKYLHLKVGKTVGIAAWDEKNHSEPTSCYFQHIRNIVCDKPWHAPIEEELKSSCVGF